MTPFEIGYKALKDSIRGIKTPCPYDQETQEEEEWFEGWWTADDDLFGEGK